MNSFSPLSAAALAQILRAYRYSWAPEERLQAGIEEVLAELGLACERERFLGRYGRIDFLVDQRIGIELKVAGSASAVSRQLARYLASPEIEGLVLVTACPSHRDLAIVMPQVEIVEIWRSM